MGIFDQIGRRGRVGPSSRWDRRPPGWTARPSADDAPGDPVPVTSPDRPLPLAGGAAAAID